MRTHHENINTTLLHFNRVNKHGHPNFQLEVVWKAGNGVDKMGPHPFCFFPELLQRSRSGSKSAMSAGEYCTIVRCPLKASASSPLYLSRMGHKASMKYRYGHGMNKQDLKLISMKSSQNHHKHFIYFIISIPSLVSLPYQSNRGSQVILIRLKWGVLSVSHIFLEQLGTGIMPLSSGTTHKLDCRLREGSLLW